MNPPSNVRNTHLVLVILFNDNLINLMKPSYHKFNIYKISDIFASIPLNTLIFPKCLEDVLVPISRIYLTATLMGLKLQLIGLWLDVFIF